MPRHQKPRRGHSPDSSAVRASALRQKILGPNPSPKIVASFCFYCFFPFSAENVGTFRRFLLLFFIYKFIQVLVNDNHFKINRGKELCNVNL